MTDFLLVMLICAIGAASSSITNALETVANELKALQISQPTNSNINSQQLESEDKP